jgi:hypothetical protein
MAHGAFISLRDLNARLSSDNRFKPRNRMLRRALLGQSCGSAERET